MSNFRWCEKTNSRELYMCQLTKILPAKVNCVFWAWFRRLISSISHISCLLVFHTFWNELHTTLLTDTRKELQIMSKCWCKIKALITTCRSQSHDTWSFSLLQNEYESCIKLKKNRSNWWCFNVQFTTVISVPEEGIKVASIWCFRGMLSMIWLEAHWNQSRCMGPSERVTSRTRKL